jgi:hypothetical protein
MFIRFCLFVLSILFLSVPANATRVALVIGQNDYPGSASATVGLPRLANPTLDARSMADLLIKHGFEVISCDGKQLGCLDLKREAFLKGLADLADRAKGADLAVVFFAGHGMVTQEGNILAPTDASVNCTTGTVSLDVPVEEIMRAMAPAQAKLLIIDACRDNPLGAVCPNLKGKQLSFTKIEAGPLQNFMLVTSTHFGQQALDGIPGAHSPFANALFTALNANPHVYFEQVMNEVARATFEGAQKQFNFVQIPGKITGGAAPNSCLAGINCVGDGRMAALAEEVESLRKQTYEIAALVDRLLPVGEGADKRRDLGSAIKEIERRARAGEDLRYQQAFDLLTQGKAGGADRLLGEIAVESDTDQETTQKSSG